MFAAAATRLGWTPKSQDEAVTETLDPGARPFHVIRNPMGMLLSAYYSHLTSHPLDGWAALAAQRGVLRDHDAQTGILLTLGFLESVHFSTNTPGPLRALQSWDYDDQRMRTLRMEDVTSTPHILFGCLREAAGAVLALPDAALFSFERLTGRRQGEVEASSHFRSGDGEEWRTGLPAAAIGYIRAHYRPLLARFYPEAL